ncbi:MAG: DNA internalization-related competence protein ComEC/Rec2 [Bacteroidota bacterium]|nr:DNA internalization-related competence protein ComEC/Rec2 [Bacteroidota bacterium]
MKGHPLIKVTLLFLSGIILQKYLSLNTKLLFYLALFFFIIAIVLLIFSKGRSKSLLIPLAIVTVLIGSISFQIAYLKLQPFPFKIPKLKNVTVIGHVESIELKREKNFKFILKTEYLVIDKKNINCDLRLLCTIGEENNKIKLDSIYNSMHCGNYVNMEGTISRARQARNPWEFDYDHYLFTKGISGVFSCFELQRLRILDHKADVFQDYKFTLRKEIDKKIVELHSPECAALLRGLILADRSEISDETQTDFINTGVVHILAVSGSNVLLIILIFSFLFGRFSPYLKTCLVIFGLFFFLAITGISSSVFRAVLMATAILIANISNRSNNIYNAISLSALIILILDPFQLFDPGFQLSYSAVLSIIYINPKLIEFLNNSLSEGKKALKLILQFTAVTISAQIGTLPFTLFYFGKLSLVSLLANVLIIPLISVITGSAIFTVVISYFGTFGARIYAEVNNELTQLTYAAAHYLSNIKYSFIFIRDFSLFDAIVFYFFLAFFFAFERFLHSSRNKIILIMLSIICFLMIIRIDDKELLQDGKLSVMAIDVGQGDATLIKFPDNSTALIDAGETNYYFDNGEKIILPILNRLGITSIDYGFISHVDSDHYSGFITLVQQGFIKRIFKPEIDSSDRKDKNLEKFLKLFRVPITYYRETLLSLGNTRLYLLNDEKWNRYYKLSKNDKSGILKLKYGSSNLLFVGDAGHKMECLLINKYGKFLSSDLLKLGHHGSKNSSSFEFLKNVNPKYGLISAGLMNKFNHPSREVLKEMDQLNIKPLRTDQMGAIILSSDGNNLSLVNWKNIY